MKPVTFYKYYGANEGAVKLRGRWVRVKGFEYINKPGWLRHRGPPNPALERALANPNPKDCRDLFPELLISQSHDSVKPGS